MVQQVNLCLPILRKQKTRFGALALLQALAVVLVASGLLGAAWVWNLNQASDSLKQTVAAQAQELAAMQAIIERNQAGAGPALAAAPASACRIAAGSGRARLRSCRSLAIGGTNHLFAILGDATARR